jgi:hypothetical protein
LDAASFQKAEKVVFTKGLKAQEHGEMVVVVASQCPRKSKLLACKTDWVNPGE